MEVNVEDSNDDEENGVRILIVRRSAAEQGGKLMVFKTFVLKMAQAKARI